MSSALTLVNGVPIQEPVNNTEQYAQAYFDVNNLWQVNNSSMADFSQTNTGTFAVRQSSGITVSAASGSLPGISFTSPSSSAAYLITASFGTYNQDGGNSYGVYQITDGTTPVSVSAGNQDVTGNTTLFVPLSLTGIYCPGTTGAVTLKIQGQGNGTDPINIQGLAGNASSMEWTLVRIA